jgi:3D (Asp-Asp-Asp) domain-containing protein
MRKQLLNKDLTTLCLLALLLLGSACEDKETKSIEVTATAYNSLPSQTHKDHPNTTAWGEELRPGMKCIAVSRDLIEMGLKHNTRVKIEGLPGTYRVADKMNQRWQKRIDIYMGNDKEAAREWGKKTVTISWMVESEALQN